MPRKTVEKLTGIFDLNTNDGTLTPTDGGDDVQAWYVPSGKTIYLAVAPGEYSGITAHWENGANTEHGNRIKGTSFTFQAGKIYDLGFTSQWTTQ